MGISAAKGMHKGWSCTTINLSQGLEIYFIFLFYNFLGDQMGLMIYLIVYLVMKTMVGCYGKKDVKCVVESGGQSFGKGKDISFFFLWSL